MTSTGPSAAQPSPSLLERLGWRAHRRPSARVAYVLGAASGVLLTVAVVALVVEVSSDDYTVPGVLLDVALLAAALVAGARLAGPVRSASVAAVVLTPPLIFGFAFAGDGSGGDGDIRGILLLSAVAYAVLYLLGWTRGRAVLLAALLVALSSWVLFEVNGGTPNGVFDSQSSSDSVFTPSLPGSDSSQSSDTFSTGEQGHPTDTGVVSLLLGLGLLAAAAALDRRKLAGAATPFIAVGATLAILGAIILGDQEGTATGGVLAIVAGAAIAVVGALGDQRRGSTWIAAITVFGGVIALCIDIAGDSAIEFAGVAAAFAIAIGVAAHFVAQATGEPDEDVDGAAAPAG